MPTESPVVTQLWFDLREAEQSGNLARELKVLEELYIATDNSSFIANEICLLQMDMGLRPSAPAAPNTPVDQPAASAPELPAASAPAAMPAAPPPSSAASATSDAVPGRAIMGEPRRVRL